jgi:hypothetical protein
MMITFDKEEVESINELLFNLEDDFSLTQIALNETKDHSVMACNSAIEKIRSKVFVAQKRFHQLKDVLKNGLTD